MMKMHEGSVCVTAYRMESVQRAKGQYGRHHGGYHPDGTCSCPNPYV
jgi:hypothetical protein